MALTAAGSGTWLSETDRDLDEFRALVGHTTDPRDRPYAEGVEQNVLVHGSARLRATAVPDRRAVRSELVQALLDGPGVPVPKRASTDVRVVDTATAAFEAIIEEEHASGTARGDDWRERTAEARPMGKLGQVDEIADFVVFPLSDRSGVVTGSVIDWDQNVTGTSD